jgi:hypothetical protein
MIPIWALLFAVSAMGQVRKYSVVISGRTAGHETLTFSGDGSVKLAFDYNDRGRGPDMTGQYVFDRQGMPVSIELNGQDYNHAPVAERFNAKAGGWYVPVNSPGADMAWLAKAMLTAKKTSMQLLPGGVATLERGATVEVKGQRVTLYWIGGLDFSPNPVWLDANNEFFAGTTGFPVIREGFEDSLARLTALEDEGDGKRLRDLAGKLGRKPAQGLAIRHVRVFDADKATTVENQIVIVRGNRIESMAADGGRAVPAGMETIDGTGKTLLPGLFDMHAHFEAYEGLLNVASGVTTIRDMGNDLDRLLGWKKQMDANEMIGPRVVLCGMVDGRGPYTSRRPIKTDNEAEARKAILDFKAQGVIQTKLYSSVPPSLVPFIVRFSHENGMRVSGHVPAGMIAEQMVDGGADEFQHINFFFLNFLPKEAPLTNTRARITLPAEHARELNLNSEPVTAFISKLSKKKVVVDPTLGVFEAQYTARPDVPSPGFAAIIDQLPVQRRRAAFQGGLPTQGDEDKKFRASFQAMLDATAQLFRAGVPLVLGTDGVQGLLLHREFELWVQAGIPAPQVLRMATIGAARIGRADADRGSVTPGKLADLALFEGNPAQDITDIRKPRVVLKDGVVYKSDELYRAAGMVR